MEQVRALAENKAVRPQVLKQVRQQAEEERKGWHAQRRGLEKELARHHAELRQVAVGGAQNEATTALIEYLHERIGQAELRIAELDEQLGEDDGWSRDDVADALGDFDEVWDSFSFREQRYLVGLLVSKIEFDPEDSSLTMEFHATVIDDIDRGLGMVA
jgi:site-specific DNA recombinase